MVPGDLALKPVFFVALLALALRTHGQLRSIILPDAAAQPAVAALRRTTAITGSVGLLLVIDVAALIYMHYVSHLGVLLPG